MNFQIFSKYKFLNRWTIAAIGLGILMTGGIVTYVLSQFGQVGARNLSQPDNTTVTTKKVTALGRLEPETEIVKLGVPVILDGDRIAELQVKQGDRLEKGQIIAVLDSRDRLQATFEEAQKRVSIAEARLAQVQAGAKSGEIQAQSATIRRIQAELQGEMSTQTAAIARVEAEFNNAQTELNRYQQLYREGGISQSLLDSKRLTMETAEARLRETRSSRTRTSDTLRSQIDEAEANLSRIAEVRPVDIQVAQAEIDNAIAAVKRTKTELQQAYIRAPFAGQILKIYTRVGEKVSSQGIADFGQTAQMVAIAEVYQTDVNKIQVGQTAKISSQAFVDEVKGTVVQVGLQVLRQNVFSNQPGENLDRRVVEVKIRLTAKDSKRVEKFTNLQVQVAIDLEK
ncbi:ABC exporter membrane fusion protein [Tumidithrix helvetica PCC 7403]|uniref:ABC exporter membrane fusion protein n=1 Tax=Tumidithrix helvetica TaxID=3457545 RepID=UPI003CA9DCA4